MLIGAVLPVNIVNINSLSLGKEDGGPWGIWDFRARGQNEPPTDYSSLFTLPLPLWKSQACVLSKVRFILLIVFFKLVWNHLCQFIQNRHLEQIWNKKHSSWELFAGLLTTFGKNRNTTQQWAEFQMICMLGFCGRIECIPGAGEKLKLWPFGLKLLQKPHLALPFFFFFLFANSLKLLSHCSLPWSLSVPQSLFTHVFFSSDGSCCTFHYPSAD